MFRLSVASRALGLVASGAAREAGVELKSVKCDTQTISIPIEVKGKKVEKKFQGGAVTVTLRAINSRLKADYLTQVLADLVHGHPNSSHQWTLRQLNTAFTGEGKQREVSADLKEMKVHEVHAVIPESAGTLYHRIRLTYRNRGLDIEIRTWKPEHFDLTGRTRTSTNPDRMERGFVHTLRNLEKGFKEHGVTIQWPRQRRG